MIKVGVVGSLGKMGREVVKAVTEATDMEIVLAIDVVGEGIDIGAAVLGKENGVKVTSELINAIKTIQPDVIVDFTQPATIFEHVSLYLANHTKCVIGTTGLNEDQIEKLKKMSEGFETSCFIAPNFTTGAVLMMMFAKQAAKYFNNAEIIELHHNQKKDAPSGTAVKTAQIMAEINENFATGNCPEKETIEGARGANAANNIHIHSVRMPGYIASQEVIFGASGQILTIRHDSMDRTCYMAGVLMAIRYTMDKTEFVYGLDNVM
ncbi:MAG: 4-hydroxy-tetrahydrodipicolinate reductase [Candidatus Gastranaerophilales bacterium]|nr:4-hydroxy-tetrahydrodipicolinate reductase [Candidatus Gastranaerophilales bacterium]